VLELGAATTIFWDVDAPATLARLEADEADPLRALVPRYDLVLHVRRRRPVVERYRALGARDCVPVYNALDPRRTPGPPDERFRCDLAFLGNRLPDREARVEEFFLRAARAGAERRSCSAARLGRQAAAAERAHPRARLDPRPQRAQRDAALRAQRLPREHGGERLLARHPRLRGRGRGACLSRTPGRASSSSSNPARRCSSHATGPRWPSSSRASTLREHVRSARRAPARAARAHVRARAAEVERLLEVVRA
jgi:hypothetical protein